MSLDLEEGDEALADETPAERRRRARQAVAKEGNAKAKKSSTSRRTAADRTEAELLSRLDRVFDRIALTLEARGDTELAEVIRDDRQAMSQGLASATHAVTFLRNPLVMVLNLVEPALAFGRVVRILYGRWIDRRVRIMEERERESSPAPTQ